MVTNSASNKVESDQTKNSDHLTPMIPDHHNLTFFDDTTETQFSVSAGRALWSPIRVKWLYFHNKARLRWGIERRFELKDVTVSHKIGLTLFPGMDGEGFIQEAALDFRNYDY